VRNAIKSNRSLGGKTLKSIEGVFKAIDKDGSGDLDHDEFQTAMDRLGLGLSPLQVEQCIEVLDKDHDGEVSLTEFMILVNGGDEPERAPNPDEEALRIWRAAFDKFDLDGNGSSPAAACCSASTLPSMRMSAVCVGQGRSI